jgi:hypothetical protein
MNLILRTIPDLLVMSRIPSETPNNFGLTKLVYPISTLAVWNVKRATLRVRECADMTETVLWSITIRGIWKYVMTPTHSWRSYQMNLDVGDSINPVFHSLYLAIFYLPEIRSSVSLYLVSISLPASTLSRSHSTMSPCDQTHWSRACKRVGHCSTEWAQSISLRFCGGVNPNLDSYNPTDTFRRTCKTSVWSPFYEMTVDAPKAFFQ